MNCRNFTGISSTSQEKHRNHKHLIQSSCCVEFVRSLCGVEEFPGGDRGIKEIISNDIHEYMERKTPHKDTARKSRDDGCLMVFAFGGLIGQDYELMLWFTESLRR